MNAISNAVYEITVPNQLDSGDDTTYTVKSAASAPSTVIATHVGIDGLGVPEVRRKVDAFPTADGGIDTGYQLQPRQLTWKMLINEATEAAYDAARDQLQRVFMPLGQRPHVLKVTPAGGGTRCLDVYVSGAVEFAQSGQMGYSALATFQLMAPDPIWYTPTERSQALGLTSSSGSANVDYLGNWFESPVIELTGELSSPQVEDAQGNTIFFQGHTIPAGQTYVVDLRPGAKTVINSSSGAAWPGNDVSEFVVKNTGWNEFRLLPGPLAAAGSGALNRNPITATFDSKGPGAAIVVKWYDRWLNL